MVMKVRRILCAMAVVAHALLAGCASTSVTLSPSPQASLCDRTGTALVLWAPQWRAHQKDILDREVAAEMGLRTFWEEGGNGVRNQIPSDLQKLLRSESASLFPRDLAGGTRIRRVANQCVDNIPF